MKLFLWFVLGVSALLLNSACAIQISEQSSPPNASQPVDESADIPVTWGSLHLTGRLIYVVADFKGGSEKGGLRVALRSLDLVSGKVTTIFETEVGGWIRSLAVAPDFKNLIISYSPAPDSPLAGKEELYILPADGSKPPQLLFTPPSDQDQYFQPDWSPDGKYIYFAHVNYQSPSQVYEVMRMMYPDGKPEPLIEQAYWPRLSADGSHLAYVSVFSATGPNGLFIANADGTQTQAVPLAGSSWLNSIIDAPLFLPDGQTILFSAPMPVQSSAPAPRWVDRLMGVTVVHAHGSIPSDWWSVPIVGAQPTRLTHVYSPGLFASLSPDSKYVASYSATGIFVMTPQGGDLTQIVNYTGGIPGSVNWIP